MRGRSGVPTIFFRILKWRFLNFSSLTWVNMLFTCGLARFPAYELSRVANTLAFIWFGLKKASNFGGCLAYQHFIRSLNDDGGGLRSFYLHAFRNRKINGMRKAKVE